MKYVVGAIAFVMVFVFVLFIVTIALATVFPTGDTNINVLADWRGWVGLVLGLLAGYSSWKASTKR